MRRQRRPQHTDRSRNFTITPSATVRFESRAGGAIFPAGFSNKDCHMTTERADRLAVSDELDAKATERLVFFSDAVRHDKGPDLSVRPLAMNSLSARP
jgi:hypothetical protein